MITSHLPHVPDDAGIPIGYTMDPQLKLRIRGERDWFTKCLGILTYHTFETLKRDNRRGVKWKVSDTARELELSVGFVSESIKLAKALPKFNGQLEKMTREQALEFLRKLDTY